MRKMLAGWGVVHARVDGCDLPPPSLDALTGLVFAALWVSVAEGRGRSWLGCSFKTLSRGQISPVVVVSVHVTVQGTAPR